MPHILQIAQLGHPVLREIAQPVSDIHAPEVKTLIDDLIATLTEVGGLGLAAPQVHQSVQVVIVASKPTQNYPDAPLREPFAMINPTILSKYDDSNYEWEGCLSIPGLRGHIQRPSGVTVQYLTQNNEEKTETFEGFMGRIVQHELDHLNGRVYIDHLTDMYNLMTEREFMRMRQNSN